MSDAQAAQQGGNPARSFSAPELARLSDGRLVAPGGSPIRGAAVDSRLVRPGNLFVALPGERTDGHRFLRSAADAGAAAVLVSRAPEPGALPAGVAIIEVADTLAAFHAIAAAWRRRFEPLVVGVTGSIAKTSTKDAVAAVLASRFRTLRSEGNRNNEIGLPITILELGPEHEAVVVEMGMYVGGEIAQLAAIALPSIGVVTAVQAVHLSRIGTLDAVERAKAELVEALPASGTAVLNADDPRVRRMADRTPAAVLTYGFPADADVRAEDVQSLGADGMRFTLTGPDMHVPAATRTLGRHGVHNALAAAAVGVAAGMSSDEIVRGIASGRTAEHRGVLISAGDVLLLDDTYNASTGSMHAALDLLAELPGRRVAVLGEMLELGSATDPGHREVGELAAARSDLLVVIGAGARLIAEGARRAGMPKDRILAVADRDAAAETLRERLRPGDVVLLKASRGAGLDLLVEQLRAERARPPGAVVEPGR